MEGERRKRKLLENDEEEESEEQQMEKFFALIRSTKDVRGRLTTEKKKEERSKGSGAVWNPTFQPEDFIDDEELARIHHTTSHAPAPPSYHKEVAEKELPEEATALEGAAAPPDENGNKKKASDDDDLDLKLSL